MRDTRPAILVLAIVAACLTWSVREPASAAPNGYPAPWPSATIAPMWTPGPDTCPRCPTNTPVPPYGAWPTPTSQAPDVAGGLPFRVRLVALWR